MPQWRLPRHCTIRRRRSLRLSLGMALRHRPCRASADHLLHVRPVRERLVPAARVAVHVLVAADEERNQGLCVCMLSALDVDVDVDADMDVDNNIQSSKW